MATVYCVEEQRKIRWQTRKMAVDKDRRRTRTRSRNRESGVRRRRMKKMNDKEE